MADATLIAHHQMNSPNTLTNSAGAAFYNSNLVDPGGSAAPTFLATGGVSGSGAYQFDGVDDNFGFAAVPGYTFIQANNLDWTVSFWIKATDTTVNLSYAGTPQLPVLGNNSGSIGFGLGVDGGKAAYRRYSGSWQAASGVATVADGIGHFVTFVAIGSSNLNI